MLEFIYNYLPCVSIIVILVFLVIVYIKNRKRKNIVVRNEFALEENSCNEFNYLKDVVLLSILCGFLIISLKYFGGLSNFIHEVITKISSNHIAEITSDQTNTYNELIKEINKNSGPSLLDYLSFVLTLMLDGIAIFMTYYIFKRENEFTSNGMIYFDAAKIYNIRNTTNNKLTLEIALIDDTPSLSQKHQIILEKIEVYICLVKEIFESNNLFERYKNDPNYCRKICVDLSDANVYYTNVTNNSVDFNFKIKEKSELLNDILISNMFYEDTKMMVINIEYKLDKKIVEPKSIYDKVNDIFSSKESNRNQQIFFEQISQDNRCIKFRTINTIDLS